MTAEIIDLSPNKRKLVTIRTVDEINQIEGADAIEVAAIGGWNVVVKKNEVKAGDKVVYFEIDSFLPDGNPAWQFLVDKSSRTFEGVVGHRLRTVKLRGQVSQGFIVPLDALPVVVQHIFSLPEDADIFAIDFAEMLGIVKWEQPLPAELVGQAEGLFPSWMRKTDQERCQNLVSEIFGYEDRLEPFDTTSMTQEALDTMQEKGLLVFDGTRTFKINKAKADRSALYEVTMKLDGSSMTVFGRKNGDVIETGVCSRNLQLKVNEANADNTFISVALKSGLLGALEDMVAAGEGNVAVQGELMGPGIQGNREGLKTHQLYIFDVQFLDAGCGYLTPSERGSFIRALYDRGVSPELVKHVPVLHGAVTLDELGITDVKQLLAFAEGPSISHAVREGLVFKRLDGKFSFKAISNLFLAKEKD